MALATTFSVEQLQQVSNAIYYLLHNWRKLIIATKHWIALTLIPWFAWEGNKIFATNVNISSNSSFGTVLGTLIPSYAVELTINVLTNCFCLQFFWKNCPIHKSTNLLTKNKVHILQEKVYYSIRQPIVVVQGSNIWPAKLQPQSIVNSTSNSNIIKKSMTLS